MAKKVKQPKTLFDKVKAVDEDFATAVYALKDEELNNAMANLAKYQTEIEEAKSNDQDLKSLREQLKVAGQTYSEPLSAIKLKCKLVVQILRERGKM